ncbi:hypothetical protein EDD86DRAFT_116758 [Gorgonomyces haynaldii]|nr:hypothetical protein EDD86DRAFT_116758 [Gorgonomyces haynaldii]
MLPLLFTAALALELVEFDPPTFTLVDSETKFKCRLKNKPSGDVRLFFEAPGLTFGNCSYLIPAEKYSDFLEIPVRGVPVFVDRPSDDITVTVKVDTPDSVYGDTKETYKGKRTYSPCGTCVSVGDPHLVTFDGFATTRHDLGTYWFLKQEHLEVQVTHVQCSKEGIACNGAVSIRYGKTVLALDVREGKGDESFKIVTGDQKELEYTAPAIKGSGRTHTVVVPGGTTLQVTHNINRKQGSYLDINLHLGEGLHGYGGICNQIKPSTPETLHCSDGKDVSRNKATEFVTSWKVDDKSNHLFGNYRTTNPEMKEVYKACSLPPVPTLTPPKETQPPLPQYTVPVSSEVYATTVSTVISTTIVTSTTVLPTVTTTTVVSTSVEAGTTTVVTSTSVLPALSTSTQAITSTVATVSTVSSAQPQYTQPPANPEYTKEVTAHCQGLFAAPGCDKLIPSAPYVQACVSDALTTGNYLMSEAMKIAYLARCNTLTGYMQQDVQPAVVQNATQVRKDCGLGSNQCINSCSGKGLCGPNGCVCNPGFGGLDCSVDLNAKVSYNQDTKQYGTNNPVYQQMPAPTENKDALPAAAPSPAGYGQTAQSTLGPVLSSAEAKSVIGLLALALAL